MCLLFINHEPVEYLYLVSQNEKHWLVDDLDWAIENTEIVNGVEALEIEVLITSLRIHD